MINNTYKVDFSYDFILNRRVIKDRREKQRINSIDRREDIKDILINKHINNISLLNSRFLNF